MRQRSHVTRRRLLAGGGAALLLPARAMAQAAWPTRPVRVIVPYPPAGGADTVPTFVLKSEYVTDRFAAFEAQALNVHVDFPVFQRLALPIPHGVAKIPGIKLHDTRMIRLMEVLLHTGTQVMGWRTADIHQAILSSFSLTPESYTLTQLRYDLRKMKAHGLLERDGRRYAYRLTTKGTRAALLFVLFHQRVCGPKMWR